MHKGRDAWNDYQGSLRAERQPSGCSDFAAERVIDDYRRGKGDPQPPLAKSRARWRIEWATPAVLAIRDIGHDDPTGNYPTITNDAEMVVADVVESGLLRKRRLLYYDSEGELSELVLDAIGWRFARFAPVADLFALLT